MAEHGRRRAESEDGSDGPGAGDQGDPSEPPRRGAHLARGGSSASAGWRQYLLPALLAVGAVGGGVGAMVLDDAPSASAVSAVSPETPVFSSRRAPELLTVPLAERQLAPKLETWIAEAPPASCLVVEGSGSPLFSQNASQPVPGASLQKIVTGTAALIALGPDAQLETAAASTAGIGQDGVLADDLYLIGGGDPLLATEGYGNQLQRGADQLNDLAGLVETLRAEGLTRIQGSVVGDETRYDAERFHEAWPERFRSQNQIGPVSALAVNDGFSSFPAEYSGPLSRVKTDDPAANAAAVLTELLGQQDITVDGEPKTGTAPDNATPIATLPSPPLSDIVAETLAFSDNDTAELLFKEMAFRSGGAGTWEAGQSAVPEVLAGAGIPMEGIEIVDGSGLSDGNRMTCDFIVDLLTWEDTGQIVVEGLSVAGETGTLDERYADSEVAGRLRAKTGTLQNVSALSGQATTRENGSLTFAFIATVADPGVLTYEQANMMDGLAEILVNHTSGVDLGSLLPAGYPN